MANIGTNPENLGIVREISTTDSVLGGPLGTINLQATDLINRDIKLQADTNIIVYNYAMHYSGVWTDFTPIASNWKTLPLTTVAPLLNINYRAFVMLKIQPISVPNIYVYIRRPIEDTGHPLEGTTSTGVNQWMYTTNYSIFTSITDATGNLELYAKDAAALRITLLCWQRLQLT